MTTELITDWAKVRQLAPEWNELIQNSRADSLFFKWEWVECWIDIHHDCTQPFVIVVRDDHKKLIGLAPFYVGAARLLRAVPYRVLRIIGDYASGAEYLDWIAEYRCELDVYRSIADTLRSLRSRWDCIWMPYVAEWTEAHKRIVSSCAFSGFLVQTRPAEFGYFDLPKTFGEYIRGMSRNRREHLNAEINRTFSHPSAAFRRCEHESELPDYLDTLFRLHHARRSLIGDPGVFVRKPAEATFYRRFSAMALNQGWLRIYGLWSDGEFKAIQYGYAYKGVFYQLQEGFDPDFIKGCGNALRSKVIEACIAEGLHGYDFLGEMTEHKRRWRAVQRNGQYLFIAHASLKNRIVFSAGLWPTGKYFRLVNPVSDGASRSEKEMTAVAG